MLVIILVIKQATTRSLYVTIALMPMRRLGQARWAGWVKHPRSEKARHYMARARFSGHDIRLCLGRP